MTRQPWRRANDVPPDLEHASNECSLYFSRRKGKGTPSMDCPKALSNSRAERRHEPLQSGSLCLTRPSCGTDLSIRNSLLQKARIIAFKAHWFLSSPIHFSFRCTFTGSAAVGIARYFVRGPWPVAQSVRQRVSYLHPALPIRHLDPVQPASPPLVRDAKIRDHVFDSVGGKLATYGSPAKDVCRPRALIDVYSW